MLLLPHSRLPADLRPKSDGQTRRGRLTLTFAAHTVTCRLQRFDDPASDQGPPCCCSVDGSGMRTEHWTPRWLPFIQGRTDRHSLTFNAVYNNAAFQSYTTRTRTGSEAHVCLQRLTRSHRGLTSLKVSPPEQKPGEVFLLLLCLRVVVTGHVIVMNVTVRPNAPTSLTHHKHFLALGKRCRY